MKKYTKVYMDFFGYDVSDWMQCEVCGRTGVDLHHIYARSIRKDLENDITNLICLCREHHIEYGDKKQHRQFLIDTHNEFMEKYGKK